MLYWLIPYLVAFNATGSENWPHGPEYLFKAEMWASIQLENNITTMTNYEINFSCRPLNESSIRCTVESGEINDTETHGNDAKQEKKMVQRDFNVANWTFEVEFDRNGVHSIVSPNNEEEDVRRNIIRAIFDAINIGSGFVSQVKIGYTLFSNEASLIGTCDANVAVMAKSDSSEGPVTRVGVYMDVPAFTMRSENETLVIVKDRSLNHCSVNTPYFFSNHPSHDHNINYNVTISETAIFFGRNQFGGSTTNLGTLTTKLENPEHSGIKRLMSGKAKDKIRVSLEAVRGATEKL